MTVLPSGWLRNFIRVLDDKEVGCGSGRWDWWLNCVLDGDVSGSIPYIDFQGTDESWQSTKMLDKCVYGPSGKLERFLDWFLWAVGDPIFGQEYPAHVTPEEYKEWYSGFDAGLLIREPADHFGRLLSEHMGGGAKSATGFFPTPMAVTTMMTQMIMDGCTMAKSSVCDPAVGTGATLLSASNYSVNLYGTDIQLVVLKAATIQAWLYIPWLLPIWPLDCIKDMKTLHSPRLMWGNTISLECYYQTRGYPKPLGTEDPPKPEYTDKELKEITKQRDRHWDSYVRTKYANKVTPTSTQEYTDPAVNEAMAQLVAHTKRWREKAQ